ncbi:hypothetical protein V6N13_084254 [Hibiscus sabdariffa]
MLAGLAIAPRQCQICCAFLLQLQLPLFVCLVLVVFSGCFGLLVFVSSETWIHHPWRGEAEEKAYCNLPATMAMGRVNAEAG